MRCFFACFWWFWTKTSPKQGLNIMLFSTIFVMWIQTAGKWRCWSSQTSKNGRFLAWKTLLLTRPVFGWWFRVRHRSKTFFRKLRQNPWAENSEPSDFNWPVWTCSMFSPEVIKTLVICCILGDYTQLEYFGEVIRFKYFFKSAKQLPQVDKYNGWFHPLCTILCSLQKIKVMKNYGRSCFGSFWFPYCI